MFENALKLLNIIESKGYKAYIVGGFPRDLYLGRRTIDIDICTNATPKDLKEIFESSKMTNDKYGSISLYYRKIRFEITTFRQDIEYINNRKPSKFKYIDDLKEDLKRRDFTINTLCIDKDGNLLDLLEVKRDVDNKIIKMVGNPRNKLKEDSLRILRAIRFATVLDFDLDNELKKYIRKHGHLVKQLSYYRKKEELDKIFTSPNIKKGIALLKELNLIGYLELKDLDKIVITPSLIGIWAQLNPSNYQFTNNEKELIKDINIVIKENILDYNILYKYGLYVCEVAGEILNIDRKKIVKTYNELSIHSKMDIVLTPLEIAELLNEKPGGFLKAILEDLEYNLINKKIQNTKESLKEYILNNYKTTQ
jgi:tRNA nucleotidyltransferase (CCA-adding enzyme)